MIRILLIPYLMTFLSMCFVPANANDAGFEAFFELKKTDAYSVMQIWQTPARHGALTNGNARIRYSFFREGFRKRYNKEKIPLAMIVLGRNRIGEEPNGYLLYVKRDALFESTMMAPTDNESLFIFELKETDCGICESGRLIITYEDNEFSFNSENISLNIE